MVPKVVLLFVVTVFGFIEAGNIPSYIHICKRSDPHVEKCIRGSIDILRPKLRSGIPELNVPGLEPLFIKEIEIYRGDNGVKASLNNVEVRGASNFEITKLKLNIGKSTYRVGLKIPVLYADGDYDIDARVIVALKGTGRFHANITDVEGQGVLKAEINDVQGKRQMKFTSFEFAIRIGNYNLHMDNLFNGDPVLGQAANEVLNDNKAEFIPAALPFIQRKTADVLLEMANQITDGLDYDEVFPEK